MTSVCKAINLIIADLPSGIYVDRKLIEDGTLQRGFESRFNELEIFLTDAQVTGDAALKVFEAIKQKLQQPWSASYKEEQKTQRTYTLKFNFLAGICPGDD